MILEMDNDLQRVAEFMQAHFPAIKLVRLATCLAGLAPCLWGKYGEGAPFDVLTLKSAPPLDDDPHTRATANE
jgi:hypothetical protein